MHRPGLSSRFCGLILLAIVIVQPGHHLLRAAEPGATSQQELDSINQAIDQIEVWLAEANQERPEYEQRLAEIEQQVNEISLAATTTRAEIARTELELDSLRQHSATLNQARTAQTEIVKQALRAAYMEGSQGYLKLVLNQEDPALAARMLHYYQKLNSARLEQINHYQATLDKLAGTQSQLQVAGENLVADKQTLENQLAELGSVRLARQQALDELNQTISQRSGELDKLLADREALEELVEQVNQAVENIPAPAQQIAFARLKGNLPWPGQGSFISTFGARYGNGELQRQGVTLAGEPGSPVRAIHAGRVVFADWLRGSGLLMILDHGDGYMSLYGHNETLIRARGSWVNAGEEIATVGNSGGQEQAGIYFEIRYNGRPQNPAEWCMPRS